MSTRSTSNRVPVAAGFDAFVVVAFVAIGRRNHDESEAISGLVQTAAPFVLALAAAWVAGRVWNRPFNASSGLVVWLVTVGVGMLLRNVVFGDGTALSFMIVATVFLGTFLNGWRAVARLVAGRRTAGPTPISVP